MQGQRGAGADDGAKLVMWHASSPAGMREPFAEQVEIGVHDAEVPSGAEEAMMIRHPAMRPEYRALRWC